MKKHKIKVGGLYLAKVSKRLVTVRVGRIAPAPVGSGDRYYVTNLTTGRQIMFRSAAKFRCEAREKACPQCKRPVPVGEDCPFGMHALCYQRSNAARLTPKGAP
jgi:hypothetical protein